MRVTTADIAITLAGVPIVTAKKTTIFRMTGVQICSCKRWFPITPKHLRRFREILRDFDSRSAFSNEISRFSPSETSFEKGNRAGTGSIDQVRCFFLRCYRKPNTRYLDAALARARASGALVNLEDVERLSPLLLDHVNVLGRYDFVLAKSIRQGKLRPLRDPELSDDLAA
jgi:hypothetical protein